MAAAPPIAAADPPPPPISDFESGLPIPPLDDSFFSEHNPLNDDVLLDFDFSFDDLCMPDFDDSQPDFGQFEPKIDQLHAVSKSNSDSQPDFDRFEPKVDQLHAAFKSNSNSQPDFEPKIDQLHAAFKSNSAELAAHLGGDQSWDGVSAVVMDSDSTGVESGQISGYLNVPSPESNGSNRGSEEENSGVRVNCHSPAESQGSGNFVSNVEEDSDNGAVRSPNSSNSSVRIGSVEQKIKVEGSGGNGDKNGSLLKRKKEGEEDVVTNSVETTRVNKYRKSNCSNNVENNNNSSEGASEEDEKRKARLLRNRESAQLSRQRKKHYVEELEDKVKNMHSTIQDLNAKITFFMAENATLRQQVGGSGAAAAAVPPPGMVPPPPPGMYPHPAMMYPWMPCAPPYMMKAQGSQVPLVPIPRLKTQQPAQAPKSTKKVESKKVEGKKSEGPKTKKVAGVSFIGLLFFIMLFGGLVPMVNVRYGGMREAFTGEGGYNGAGFSEKHRGRVLMVNGTQYGEKHGSINSGQRGHSSEAEPSADEVVRLGNGSEPLAASLYVPRNDKLVKIDGNLIIHSVLASEKAMASRGKGAGETGLVVPGDLAPAIPVAGVGRNGALHPHLMALSSGSADKDSGKPSANGKLQQWFREGLAGPMLSAGMCTEVFHFDVSAAVVPAATTRNLTEEHIRNATLLSKGKNRRILRPIPLPESSRNISEEHSRRSSEKEGLNGSKNSSSMVVSVLFDPREAGGDADVDGVMGKKSLSRIFIVVLIDSVKYVTYSCMLPFKGSVPHLVTT